MPPPCRATPSPCQWSAFGRWVVRQKGSLANRWRVSVRCTACGIGMTKSAYVTRSTHVEMHSANKKPPPRVWDDVIDQMCPSQSHVLEGFGCAPTLPPKHWSGILWATTYVGEQQPFPNRDRGRIFEVTGGDLSDRTCTTSQRGLYQQSIL